MADTQSSTWVVKFIFGLVLWILIGVLPPLALFANTQARTPTVLGALVECLNNTVRTIIDDISELKRLGCDFYRDICAIIDQEVVEMVKHIDAGLYIITIDPVTGEESRTRHPCTDLAKDFHLYCQRLFTDDKLNTACSAWCMFFVMSQFLLAPVVSLLVFFPNVFPELVLGIFPIRFALIAPVAAVWSFFPYVASKCKDNIVSAVEGQDEPTLRSLALINAILCCFWASLAGTMFCDICIAWTIMYLVLPLIALSTIVVLNWSASTMDDLKMQKRLETSAVAWEACAMDAAARCDTLEEDFELFQLRTNILIERATADAAQTNSELLAVKEDLRTASEQLKDAMQDTDWQQYVTSTQLFDARGMLDAANREIGVLRRELQLCSTDLVAAHGHAAWLKEDFASKEANYMCVVSTLTEDLQQQQNLANTRETQIRTLRERISQDDLQRLRDESQCEIAERKYQDHLKRALEANSRQFEIKIARLEATLESVQSKNHLLEKGCRDFEEKVEDQNRAIRDHEEVLKDEQDTIRVLYNRLDIIKEQRQTLQQKVHEQAIRLKTLHETLGNLEKSAAGTETAYKSVRAEGEALRIALGQTPDAPMENVRLEITKLRAQHRELDELQNKLEEEKSRRQESREREHVLLVRYKQHSLARKALEAKVVELEAQVDGYHTVDKHEVDEEDLAMPRVTVLRENVEVSPAADVHEQQQGGDDAVAVADEDLGRDWTDGDISEGETASLIDSDEASDEE